MNDPIKREIQILPYRPGDETAIVELYRRTFDPSFSLTDWRWWYVDNPAGEQLIQLAWSAGTLAAHYAVCPVGMTVHGRPARTALSLHTMTHPSFQGRGLFPRLAETLYERMRAAAYLMVWGFPNEISHRLITRKLQWKDICEIPMLQLHPERSRVAFSGSSHVEDLPTFDERFDRLWGTVSGTVGLATRRDARYLAWRFGQHPRNRYSVSGFLRSGDLLGYIVTKPYESGLDIVDLLTVDDPEVVEALLARAIDQARSQQLSPVSVWFPVRHPTHHILEKHGFENTGRATYMGCRRLAANDDGTDLENVKNWYYTMSASDVF